MADTEITPTAGLLNDGIYAPRLVDALGSATGLNPREVQKLLLTRTLLSEAVRRTTGSEELTCRDLRQSAERLIAPEGGELLAEILAEIPSSSDGKIQRDALSQQESECARDVRQGIAQALLLNYDEATKQTPLWNRFQKKFLTFFMSWNGHRKMPDTIGPIRNLVSLYFSLVDYGFEQTSQRLAKDGSVFDKSWLAKIFGAEMFMTVFIAGTNMPRAHKIVRKNLERGYGATFALEEEHVLDPAEQEANFQEIESQMDYLAEHFPEGKREASVKLTGLIGDFDNGDTGKEAVCNCLRRLMKKAVETKTMVTLDAEELQFLENMYEGWKSFIKENREAAPYIRLVVQSYFKGCEATETSPAVMGSEARVQDLCTFADSIGVDFNARIVNGAYYKKDKKWWQAQYGSESPNPFYTEYDDPRETRAAHLNSLSILFGRRLRKILAAPDPKDLSALQPIASGTMNPATFVHGIDTLLSYGLGPEHYQPQKLLGLQDSLRYLLHDVLGFEIMDYVPRTQRKWQGGVQYASRRISEVYEQMRRWMGRGFVEGALQEIIDANARNET